MQPVGVAGVDFLGRRHSSHAFDHLDVTWCLALVPTSARVRSCPGPAGLGAISGKRLDQPGAPDRLSHQPIRRYYCAFNAFSIIFQNMPVSAHAT
jgi:hypothetical protein